MRTMDRCGLVPSFCLVAALTAACGQPPAGSLPGSAGAAEATQTRVERGRALVTTGLCHDCHTPKKFGPNGPEPDMERTLSGHPEELAVTEPFNGGGPVWTAATNDHLTAWSGPWGVSFAANLTPDTLTGLRSGVWTEELFIKALRTGRHVGTARPILPPMPWQFIGQYSDEDLKAIWAYLGTLPPILNHVPDPLTPEGKPLQ